MTRRLKCTALAFALVLPASQITLAETFAPYGTAKVDMHSMPVTDVVFDVNYADPNQLNTLYNFIKNTRKITQGKVVVVTHGPELRAFAKENYEKYQGAVDKMAELSKEGVEFKMCNNAMKAAGFSAEDMHGFITVVPAGFPELRLLHGQGLSVHQPPSATGQGRALPRSAATQELKRLPSTKTKHDAPFLFKPGSSRITQTCGVTGGRTEVAAASMVTISNCMLARSAMM